MVAVEDLVDASVVASMLGLAHRNSVITYLRRYEDFPSPVFETARCKVWVRDDIDAWIKIREERRTRRRGT